MSYGTPRPQAPGGSPNRQASAPSYLRLEPPYLPASVLIGAGHDVSRIGTSVVNLCLTFGEIPARRRAAISSFTRESISLMTLSVMTA